MATIDLPPVATETPQQFVRSVTGIVRDLLAPRPAIYWIDLIASVLVGQTALNVYMLTTNWFLAVPMFFVAAFALFRASLFLHEIQHFKPGAVPGFRLAWNILVGIPFLNPAYTNDDHQGHHSNTRFGTDDDSEYASFMKSPIETLTYYLTSIFWLPVYLVVRFMLLTPLAYVLPSVRQWLWARGSTQTWVNVNHVPHLPSAEEERSWKIQEAACCIYCWVMIGLLATGVLPWSWLANIYALSIFMITINYVRGLSSHRFRSVGEPASYRDQVLDSTTIPNGLLTALICPVGMRYHAIHHVCPSMPYHNMGIAHRRLMAQLPPDSAYHETLRRSVWHSLGDLAVTVKESIRRRRHARRATAE